MTTITLRLWIVSTRRQRPPRRSRIACVLLVGSTLVVALPVSAAQTKSDPRKQREEIRKRRAEIAAQVDVTRAEDAKVEKALKDLTADLATQEALLQSAEQAVAQTLGELAKAKADEARIIATINRLEANIMDMAIRAYIGGGQPLEFGALATSGNLSEAVRQAALAQVVFGSAQDTRSALRDAREDLTIVREQSQLAAEAAEARKAEVSQRVEQVAAARRRQAAFADQLEARIEAQLAEAASLAQLDQQLSAEIARRQEALARQNRGGRNASGSAGPIGDVPVRNVGGIWVHESIAEDVAALLEAAAGDGIILGGGGYRSSADQQRLREAHCSDPVNSPASSCHPPTARPGMSQHERGLAIDFTYDGGVITSRSNPGYRWLAANAGRFGLKNLPSEPWHWSTTGN